MFLPLFSVIFFLSFAPVCSSLNFINIYLVVSFPFVFDFLSSVFLAPNQTFRCISLALPLFRLFPFVQIKITHQKD